MRLENLKGLREEQRDSTVVIDSSRSWRLPDFRELLRYRDLIVLFVRRDLVASYKQSILGPTWFILHPLMTTAVFTVVFGKVVAIPTDGVPPFLFYLSGIVCWHFFSSCLTRTSDIFVSNAGIYGKVYFPRLVTPVAAILVNVAQFAVQYTVLLVALLWYALAGFPVRLSGWLVLIPLMLLQMTALGAGVGLIISALTARYRDLAYLIGFGLQLWMYATPIVYPASLITHEWRWILYINPMAPIVQNFRHVMVGSGDIAILPSIGSVVISALALFAGLMLFTRTERTFLDSV